MADESEKNRGGGSLILTAVLGLVGALIPTLVIMLLVRTCEDPAMERTYRYRREQLARRTMEREKKAPEKEVEATAADSITEEEDVFLTLEEGLLALAPDIYLSVRFLHEDGVALTPDELESAEGVHTIEITVRSGPWDEMASEARVDLLNDTFKYIKERYPDMTKFLRLVYDDERPSFDMKFGAEI